MRRLRYEPTRWLGEPWSRGWTGALRTSQIIGFSGDSGCNSQPHIHVHMQACDGCATIPIAFRNTRAHPQGLRQGETDVALPF